MNTREEILARLFDDTFQESDILALREEMAQDPGFAAEIWGLTRIDRLLRHQAYLANDKPDLVVGVQARLSGAGQKPFALEDVLKRKNQQRAPKRVGKTSRFVMTPLAIAASLAIVAGGVWFGLQSVGVSEPLGLRVTEATGEANIQQPTSNNQHPKETRAVVGMEIRQGERVVVKDGGKVGLKYDGEATTIELRDATAAAFGSEKGAKRVTLAAGKLVCSAAPQKMPFEIKTPHAIARVVGTRFSLDVTDPKTVLAMMEGKVELCQGEKVLEVSAGQEATATDEGMRMYPSEREVTAVPAPTGQALDQGGRVYAWGDNSFGQFGDGTTNNSPTPVSVPGLDGVTAVAVGGGHTVALKSDHTVWAWGANARGQLGDGTTANHATPVQVKLPDGTPLRGIVAVAAGHGHTVVLSEDRTVWTWGDNRDGQLGDGTRVDRLCPTRVAGLSGVAAIAASWGHTVALKTDTTVWMWGKIHRGISSGIRPTPEQVKMADGSPLAGVSSVAANEGLTVALRRDRSVWIWGSTPLLADSRSVVPVQAKLRDGTPIADVVSISAGRFWVVLLKNDGSVWERELFRDAKSGGSDSGIVPVLMKPGGGIQLSGSSAVAVGGEQALALRRDGSVWIWRRSFAGRSPAEQVRGLSNAVAIAAGMRHVVAIVGE